MRMRYSHPSAGGDCAGTRAMRGAKAQPPMPVCEVDPWRYQFFEQVPCPEHVRIPTEDADAWTWNPAHRHVYDQLQVALSQGLAAAPYDLIAIATPTLRTRVDQSLQIEDRERLANLSAEGTALELVELERLLGSPALGSDRQPEASTKQRRHARSREGVRGQGTTSRHRFSDAERHDKRILTGHRPTATVRKNL